MQHSYPTLYLKSETEEEDPVVRFLDNSGVGYRKVVVSEHNESIDDLPKWASASSLPALDWDENHHLTDVDLDALVDFLHEQGIQFEDS